MLFEELGLQHGLWAEDGASSWSEEEEELGSDWAEDRGWLQEDPPVGHSFPQLGNEFARSQPCCRQLFSPHGLQPCYRGLLAGWAGHLSGAGLDQEPLGTDLRAHPAGLSPLAPDQTASVHPPADKSPWEPGLLTGQGHLLSTRTLSHPSFYPYYAALSGSVPGPSLVPEGGSPQGSGLQGSPAIGSGLLLPISSSEFFYTDPLMPPGHRIYNYLSRPSQEVCQSLRLSTPPPIMSVREASPPPCRQPPLPAPRGTKWLSQAEYSAVTALLELPCEEPTCSPGGGSPGTQPLLSAVELEYGRVGTPEAASTLLSLHGSPGTQGELPEDTEPPAVPAAVLGALSPNELQSSSTLGLRPVLQ